MVSLENADSPACNMTKFITFFNRQDDLGLPFRQTLAVIVFASASSYLSMRLSLSIIFLTKPFLFDYADWLGNMALLSIFGLLAYGLRSRYFLVFLLLAVISFLMEQFFTSSIKSTLRLDLINIYSFCMLPVLFYLWVRLLKSPATLFFDKAYSEGG